MEVGARTRRFIVALATLAFLGFYIWLMTVIADMLPDSFWVDLIFYPIAGIAWGLPLIPLLRWADRSGRD